MNNLIRQPNSLKRAVGQLAAGFALVCTFHSGSVFSAGEVTFIDTVDEPATPTSYSIDGNTYSWGMGYNQVMQGFTSNGQSYEFANSADRVEIVRHDLLGVSSGNPCGVFVERVGAADEILKANYPSDGTDTGNCDMAAMLASRVVNRGALNMFSNIGPNPKNVERVDYLFDRGLLAPLKSSALALSGHVVAEKRGNNPLQIAAITQLDILGQPSAYGQLVLVEGNGCVGDAICYGITNLHHNYSFFQNNSEVPQGFPSFLKPSTESVGMAFVSLENLGIDAGQLYYGFSYFGDDVDANAHVLTDVSTFPQDTDDEQILFGDSADIYGGVSGFFLGDTLNVATGAVFKDENGNGLVDDDEAGISDIGLTLYQDSNGNGVFDSGEDAQVGPSFNSDVNGEFRLPGLDDGLYFLLLDESDDDLPPAISVAPGTNPAMILINGGDVQDINFAFVSDTGPSTDDGSNDGAGDDGADDGAGNDGSDDGAGDDGSDDGAGNDGSDDGAGDDGSDDGAGDDGSDDGAGNDGSDDGSDDGSGNDGSDDGSGDDNTDDGAGNEGDFIIINDGANETIANRDTASVTQGSTTTIDVLANDIDAPGQGLTIISTSEAPDAMIEIRDGVLLYTPNFGFIGMDTFLYIIEDGAGAQSTGTVDVDVLRFSDINNNGLNDFVECDCDNLTIEVGVEGSALGASSILSFFILSLLFGFRRIVWIRRSRIGGASK